MKTGRQLKEEGIARVAANNRYFQEVAESVIIELARKREPFTAEEVRERLEKIGWPVPHPNSMGAAFSTAVKHGYIEATGFSRSANRASAHSRRLVIWQGVQDAA